MLENPATILRIDWGYLYVAAPNAFAPQAGFAKWNAADGEKSVSPISETVPVEAGDVAAGITLDFGAVNDTVSSRYLIAAYDDLYSIEYMGVKNGDLIGEGRLGGRRSDRGVSQRIRESDETL